MSATKVPSYDTFMNPVIQALKDLGGSGTIEEINNKVIDLTHLTPQQLELLHDPERGGQTEIEYRLAWARTYLKKYGILENSARGVWALTSKGSQVASVNVAEVKRFVADQLKRNEKDSITTTPELTASESVESWKNELLQILLQIEPTAFERLVQRILRESGFIQVEVTGRTGDGGIDGKGIMRLGGLLSFHVIFQCKRYQGSVTASHVRDFRGAMVGRADKGILITTGNFTKDAVREATRDGAPAIDLIDGDLLVNKLKELGLGIETKLVTVEQVSVQREWFQGL